MFEKALKLRLQATNINSTTIIYYAYSMFEKALKLRLQATNINSITIIYFSMYEFVPKQIP